ncbi:DUF2313 domain-containing protein [Paraburkholderia sediminicola]|uniref:hypothetical protein n=1 Tax=Paraburkholderia sediminicola TaxID=458836 RepID=UPI0038BE0089
MLWSVRLDDENRQQVVAKLIGAGGQSIPYFVALAAALGYAVTVTELYVHTVIRPVTAPIAGPDWAFAWLVTIVSAPPPNWHTVSDAVDDPLSSLGASPTVTMLECAARAREQCGRFSDRWQSRSERAADDARCVVVSRDQRGIPQCHRRARAYRSVDPLR